jgi:hypothetical protein
MKPYCRPDALTFLVQSGQISEEEALRGEVRILTERLARAERTLSEAAFEDLGGQTWRPPVRVDHAPLAEER